MHVIIFKKEGKGAEMLRNVVLFSLLTLVIGCNPSYYYGSYWNVPSTERFVDLQDRSDYPYTAYHLYYYPYPYSHFPFSLLRYYSYDRYYWGAYDARRYEGWWHK
jgi:hypothetical protein